jgi:hypothetical protein
MYPVSITLPYGLFGYNDARRRDGESPPQLVAVIDVLSLKRCGAVEEPRG